MFVNTTTEKSYNFKAPEGDVGEKVNEVPFPVPVVNDGVADAAIIAVVAATQITVVNIDELGQASTLNVDVAEDLVPGALLIVKVPCGANPYDLDFGAGCYSCTITGVANTTKKAVLVFDGTEFVPTGLAFD